ncbi:MAG: sugar phosphate isomerase/epimerase [Eubacteriales bacterium]|nr:sugar phosphate isomerase/epimerase [Eubacteriales bacterium]
MTVKAVQQIMLGSICKNEAQILQTLHAVKNAGFDGIELNGFMTRPTSLMVRLMTKAAGMPIGKGGNFDWAELTKEAGMQIVSLHTDLGSLKRDAAAIVSDAEKYKTDKIVITGMYRFDYSDPKAIKQLADDLNDCGKTLHKEGLQLLYHNHNVEFRKLPNGQTAYSYLIEHTDPEFLNFEFDSYWPTEAGVSAIALMKRLGDRIKLYHINDRGTKTAGPSMTPILKSDSMELGTGNMNLDELIRQALDVSVDSIVLETHKNWIDNSPLKSIQVSGEFLKEYL